MPPFLSGQSPAPDILTPITDWMFAMDDLGDMDRVQAAVYQTEMRLPSASLAQKQDEPSSATDRDRKAN